MNRALILGLWRQRFHSPLRAVILGFMIFLPALPLLALPAVGLSVLGDGTPLFLLFAAGMIGQDVSSGVLQLVLARPVRRWEYVLSRWAGAASGAWVASVLQLLVAWAVLAARGAAPEPSAIGLFLARRTLEIAGGTATMAMLSALAGGLGDLALFVLLSILAGIADLAGQVWRIAPLAWAGTELGTLLTPRLDVAAMAAGALSPLSAATYASNLTLSLLIAVAWMNRKELSYASG